VATIRRLEVKMAPGGSIYALKVGQFLWHVANALTCKTFHSFHSYHYRPLFFLSNYDLHTLTRRYMHSLFLRIS